MGSVTSKVLNAACETAAHFGNGIKQVRDLITQVSISVKNVAVGSVKAVGNAVEASGRLAAGLTSGVVGLTCKGLGKLANYADNPGYGRVLEERAAKINNFAIQQCKGSYEAAKYSARGVHDTLKAATKVVAGSITTVMAGVGTAVLTVGATEAAVVEGAIMIGAAMFRGTTAPSKQNDQRDSGLRFDAGGAFRGESGLAPRNANEIARLLGKTQDQVSELKLCVNQFQAKEKAYQDEIAELRRGKVPAIDS